MSNKNFGAVSITLDTNGKGGVGVFGSLLGESPEGWWMLAQNMDQLDRLLLQCKREIMDRAAEVSEVMEAQS